jgi:pantoate kinase
VERLLASPTAATMMALSKKFALDTGLATARLREAIAAAEAIAPASQAMLGNSVFALCPADRVHDLQRALEPFGRVLTCGVAWDGPRVL